MHYDNAAHAEGKTFTVVETWYKRGHEYKFLFCILADEEVHKYFQFLYFF